VAECRRNDQGDEFVCNRFASDGFRPTAVLSGCAGALIKALTESPQLNRVTSKNSLLRQFSINRWQTRHSKRQYSGREPFLLLRVVGWINRNQHNAIEYLREEVKVLREQLGKRPRFSDEQRRRLAAKAQRLTPESLQTIASIVSPRTLLRWHQSLVARKYDGSHRRAPGRPRTGRCLSGCRYLLHDRSPLFSEVFGMVLRGAA
jgi:hypothetical protein